MDKNKWMFRKIKDYLIKTGALHIFCRQSKATKPMKPMCMHQDQDSRDNSNQVQGGASEHANANYPYENYLREQQQS